MIAESMRPETLGPAVPSPRGGLLVAFEGCAWPDCSSLIKTQEPRELRQDKNSNGPGKSCNHTWLPAGCGVAPSPGKAGMGWPACRSKIHACPMLFMADEAECWAPAGSKR